MIKGIVFDKDGTLFDFNATWGAWSRQMLHSESAGDHDKLEALADILGYDLQAGVFRPGSIVIAETVDVIATAMLTVIDDDKPALIARMNAATQKVPQIEATPLVPFMGEMTSRGLSLGVATNDAEVPARRHLQVAGILDDFDFVAGSDSGYGGKPEPGQLIAFCNRVQLPPEACVMVGDSLHDLHAGRAAGMTTVGVLTGPAPLEELAPFADTVLASVAELPAWLDQ